MIIYGTNYIYNKLDDTMRKINNKLIVQLVKYGCIYAIKNLCQLPIVYFDPNFNNNIVLKKVTINGNFEIFKYLFALAKNNIYHANVQNLSKHAKLFECIMRKILKISAIHGHGGIIKYLLNFPNPKKVKNIDITIVLTILKEIISRPFMENKISHTDCYELINYLLGNNLHRISIENLLEIDNKINAKINHLNYDLNKYKLFIVYLQRAINIQMIHVCAMFLKKSIPIYGVGYNITTYLYKETSDASIGIKTLYYIHNKVNNKKLKFIEQVENIKHKLNYNTCYLSKTIKEPDNNNKIRIKPKLII